jgi:hypothetical protein
LDIERQRWDRLCLLHLCFCPWWLERDRLLDPELLKEDSDVEDSKEEKEFYFKATY